MLSTIGIIIDVVVIGVLVVLGLIGLKKGLLKSILSLFSWVVCLLVAFWAAKYVAVWLNGLYNFSGLIGNGIAKSLNNSNAFFAQSLNAYEAGGKEALIAAIPSDVNGLLTQLIKVVFSNSQVDMTSTDTIGYFVGSSLGHIAMVIISGLLVFIVLKIVVALLSKLFTSIEQTKILGGLNKVLGLVLGLLKGAIFIIIANVLLVALTLIPTANKIITPLIQDNTHVEKVVYNKTDELFGKYVIEGDTIKNWVEKLWQNR